MERIGSREKNVSKGKGSVTHGKLFANRLPRPAQSRG